MAGGFQVNRVPPGLLSLLDMKALGQNPVTLSEQLVPTLDLYRNYIAAVSSTVDGNTTSAVNAVGTYSFSVAGAQPGELLVISRGVAFATAALGAATTLTVRAGVVDTALAEVLQAGEAVNRTTGNIPMVPFPEFMILAPGQAIALFCEAWLAGGVAATFRFAGSVARLRV